MQRHNTERGREAATVAMGMVTHLRLRKLVGGKQSAR